MMRMDDFSLTGRVLSANSPAVLALRQGRADSFALRAAMRKGTRLGASGVGGWKDARSPLPACKSMLVEGRRNEVLPPSSPDVLAPEAQVAALGRAPARRHPQEINQVARLELSIVLGRMGKRGPATFSR